MKDDDNVINMADKARNGDMWTPKQCLKDALKAVGQEGALKDGKKVLIIALDDVEDATYAISYYQAGLKMSEVVTLCEIMKTRAIQNMGYIPEDE